jgi:glucose-fructose oxidoreductase
MRKSGSRSKSADARTASSQNGKKVRCAVIGLGPISQIAVLPAFAHARGNSQLTALVAKPPETG